MLFSGQAEASIDAKSRLAIPAKFRGLVPAGTSAAGSSPTGRPDGPSGAVWYCIAYRPGLIRLYPDARFQRLAEAVESTLTPDRDQAELEAAMFGSFERVETDSAGRITLPKDQLRLAKLGSEVMVIGARDRLEIRDRGVWMGEQEARFAGMEALAERVARAARPS